MNIKLQYCKRILKKYNQEHLLEFYNDLNKDEKNYLLDEIINLNFDEILNLYNNSKENNNKGKSMTKISPIFHIEKDKLSLEEKIKYSFIGEKIIEENKYAVVTMAGGQGTRLGYKGPKGTYEISFSNGSRMSLFEIMCKDIQKANKKYKVKIPWYIMLSTENEKETKKFFREKGYFGYPEDSIKFFVQDTIPLIDTNGKIVLQEYYKIKEVSNGNGNVFKSLKRYGIIDKLKEKGIEYISFSGIDNVLLKNVDVLFLGMMHDMKYKIASKSIFKKEPLEKTAVYCLKNGKPAILDYDDIDLELSEQKNEIGQYLYREANMLSHVMTIDAIEIAADKELPYHRAFKKNPIINEEGMKIVPTKPNTFKFENFIFDSFKFFDDMMLLRVKTEEEFAPIKDFTGIYTPETAKEAYERIYKEYGSKETI